MAFNGLDTPSAPDDSGDSIFSSAAHYRFVCIYILYLTASIIRKTLLNACMLLISSLT